MDKIPYEELYQHPGTVRQRRNEQLNTIKGIIGGIDADRLINEHEVRFVNQWLDEHAKQAEQLFYADLAVSLNRAISDGVLSMTEKEEIVEHIDALQGDGFYDTITQHMQVFQGMLGGIASDGRIEVAEVRSLREWMGDHVDLQRHWPFTEIDSLMTAALGDGRIDPEEHTQLLRWCGAFTDISSHKTVLGKGAGFGKALPGIAASAPAITFDRASFCVTGTSARAKRSQIEEYIERLGGMIAGVSRKLDYLILCDAGSKCWAYACYGRKVEAVMENRQAGTATTLIIQEVDLWDALADNGIEHR
jgi:NAD-dependent DNA ligase